MPYQRENDLHYYATEEESRIAHAEFEQSFPLMYQAATQSFANAVRNIRAYYETHDLPEDKDTNDYALHSPARQIMNMSPSQFDTSSPEDRAFENAFQQIFREEYPEQYMTDQLLGEHLQKMKESGIKRTEGNIFLYSSQLLGNAEEIQSSQRDLINQQTEHLKQLRQSGCSEKELREREKAIRMYQQLCEKTRKLHEQSHYVDSRIFLISYRETTLIQQTSQQTHKKFLNLANTELDTLNYEVAQNCAVMHSIGKELQKNTFSFSNVEQNLKYYQQAVYQQALKDYDLQRAADVQASPNLSAEAKILSSTLASNGFEDVLNAAGLGLNATHRFGRHSDSPEMQQLKASTANLKAVMNGMDEKLLNDPAYAERVQRSLEQTLKDANAYLTEKDKEGKALSDRTQMGQSRYKAAQALAENIQRIKINQQWRKYEQFQQRTIEATADPAYQDMLRQQLTCKQSLFALTNKPEWTAADRQAIHQGIATLVSCEKLVMEEVNTHNTDGPMWTYQKQHGNLIQKVAAAIKDDAPIREAANSMNQHKLASFLAHGDDRNLSIYHTQNWLKSRPAEAKQNAAAAQKTQAHTNEAQRKKA